MNRVIGAIGKRLAVYLSKELEINGKAPPSNPLHLKATCEQVMYSCFKLTPE